MEWINGLAWPWALLLGLGAGTVLVVVCGIIPLLIMDERRYKRQERAMIAVMDYKVMVDCANYGLSKKVAYKIIADRKKMMKPSWR